MFDNAEERYLRETLAILQESYAKAALPGLWLPVKDGMASIRSKIQE